MANGPNIFKCFLFCQSDAESVGLNCERFICVITDVQYSASRLLI